MERWEHARPDDRGAARLLGPRGLQRAPRSPRCSPTDAPRGSIYHHFPDGKDQLVAEAIGWTSEQILAHLKACPEDALRRAPSRNGLACWPASSRRPGCPGTGPGDRHH